MTRDEKMTIIGTLREIQQDICNNYCKYPEQAKNQEDLDENHCRIL